MMEMKRPKITYEENESGSFARFVVEPLERGFGTTLGNSLRRILLSALPGAAPVGIKIAGVDHEPFPVYAKTLPKLSLISKVSQSKSTALAPKRRKSPFIRIRQVP